MPADKDDIKRIVSIQDILTLYSIESDRHKKFLCPFHLDTNPSLSIKNNIFTCWACGSQGDIFKFVQLMNNCTFSESLNIICDAFGIENGTQITPAQRNAIQERRRHAVERAELIERGIYTWNRLTAYRRFLIGLDGYAPERFHNLEYLDYLMEFFLSDMAGLARFLPDVDLWLKLKHKKYIA